MDNLKYIFIISTFFLFGVSSGIAQSNNKTIATISKKNSNSVPAIKKVEMISQQNETKVIINKDTITYLSVEKKRSPSKVTPTLTFIKKKKRIKNKELKASARNKKSSIKPSLERPKIN